MQKRNQIFFQYKEDQFGGVVFSHLSHCNKRIIFPNNEKIAIPLGKIGISSLDVRIKPLAGTVRRQDDWSKELRES